MHTILQNKSKPIKKYDVGELIGTTKKIFPEMQLGMKNDLSRNCQFFIYL